MLIAAEKNIRQPIIIYIADGNTTSIKKIAKGIRIKFFSIENRLKNQYRFVSVRKTV